MDRRLTYSLKDIRYFTLILFVNLVILLPQSRFDPDPHHDGYMFAGAVAASKGLLPNKDFFAQYGPLTPVIQGIWLRIFGERLVNLRILTAILIALTGSLLFLLIATYRNIRIAILFQTFWILSYPVLPLPHSLPWSSVISTFLLLLSFFFYEVSKFTKYPRIFLTLQGFILGILYLFRIQLIIIPLMLVLSYCFLKLGKGGASQHLTQIVLSSFVSFLFSILTLIQLGIWVDYIEQCVTWPSKYYGASYSPLTIFTKNGFIYWTTWYYYPAFFFLFLFGSRRFIRSRKKEFENFRNLGYQIARLIGGFSIGAGFYVFIQFNFFPKSYLNPLLQLQWLIQRTPLAILFFAATYVAVIFFFKIPHFNFLKEVDPLFYYAIGSVVLLYPGSDPLHLWWYGPPLLLFLARYSPSFSWGFRLTDENFLTKVLGVSIFLSLWTTISLFSQYRVSFDDKILQGMLGKPKIVQSLDQTINGIAATIDEYDIDSFVFQCRDGLYSVANGNFLSETKAFVDWAPSANKSVDPTAYIFVCNETSENLLLKYPSSEYEVIFISELSNGVTSAILHKISSN